MKAPIKKPEPPKSGRKVSEPGARMPKEGVSDVKTSRGNFTIRGS